MDPGTIELVRRAMTLKDTPRKGWFRAGVARPESVADHSWGVALLALVAAEGRRDLDRARLLELAILHDLSEAWTGDLVPGDYKDRAEKLSRERAGLEALVEGAPTMIRRRILDRFEELATDASEEAKLVHQLDKLEMAFQAAQYESAGVAREQLAPYRQSAASGVRSAGLRYALDKLEGR
jgi:putative hydrolases of HD superfamily